MEKLLTIADIMELFGVSRVSVYRWINLARKGQHRFPLPVGDHKQKLRWSREAIAAYQNASNPQPAPKLETAAKRKKRDNAARDRLRSKGVNVNDASEV